MGSGASAASALLAVNNLEVVYDDVIQVLRGVSLTVPEGKIVALLGANGAGKTTLLLAITGLLDFNDGEITKGSVVFDGQPIHDVRPTKIVALGRSRSDTESQSTKDSPSGLSNTVRHEATPADNRGVQQ